MKSDTKLEITQKWGFGMAPISSAMQVRYDLCVQTTLEYLEELVPAQMLNLDQLSEIKGMFNRCIRQDQWDWFTVHSEFGLPEYKTMKNIVSSLVSLRESVKNESFESCEIFRKKLINLNILNILHTYQNGLSDKFEDLNGGWLYVLSTRENPDILKIGMTNRSINTRIKEINSATGVIFPFSARKVFRVKNAKRAEQLIHDTLGKFRLRADREFFRIDFNLAVRIIGSVIRDEKMKSRQQGVISKLNFNLNYGFIETKSIKVIFFHRSQIGNGKFEKLSPSTLVEFDLGQNLKGYTAINIEIISSLPTALLES